MFYLFIFESIGTSELMLIGLVALIIFGPRKLPELARTIGKTMADFRRSTDDFKKTWEQEIAFEDDKKSVPALSDLQVENTIGNTNSISREIQPIKSENNELKMPEIKELNEEDFNKNFAGENFKKTENSESAKINGDKRDWL